MQISVGYMSKKLSLSYSLIITEIISSIITIWPHLEGNENHHQAWILKREDLGCCVIFTQHLNIKHSIYM